jgi:hypothetical protein
VIGTPVKAASGVETGSVSLSPIAGSLEENLRSRFDRNALPAGSSDATFQNGEMFRLSGSDMAPLIVAPISFDTAIHVKIQGDSDSGSHVRFDCGAFFLEADGHRSFSRTTAIDSSLDCMGLVALGAMPYEGPRPRLLFLYHMGDHYPRSDDRPEVDVLVWGISEHKYVVDRPLSRWLTAKLPHPTIADVRRLLAGRGEAGVE